MPRELDDSDFDAVVDELFGPQTESFGRHGGRGPRRGRGRFHRRGPRRWGHRPHRWHQRGPWFNPYWWWGYPGYYPVYEAPPMDPDQIADLVAGEDDEDEDEEDFGELEFDDEDFGELEFDDEEFGYGEASIETKLGPYLSRQNTAGLRGYPLEWRWP